jgi:hypothetical protein
MRRRRCGRVARVNHKELTMRTLMLIPCLVLALTAAAAADPPTLSEEVEAVHSLESAARGLASVHFAALASGDTKTLDRIWVRSATSTSRSGANEIVTPIRRAVRRWVAKRDGMTWALDEAGVLADGRVFVTANVTWNGGTFYDVLVLERSVEEPLHLVAKISTAIEQTSGHY